jgi:hypothetical protein
MSFLFGSSSSWSSSWSASAKLGWDGVGVELTEGLLLRDLLLLIYLYFCSIMIANCVHRGGGEVRFCGSRRWMASCLRAPQRLGSRCDTEWLNGNALLLLFG